MRENTLITFENIAKTYKAAGFPNHRSWYFEPNDDEDITIFRELRAYGLIEPFTMGEQRWRFTEFGLERALDVE